ncbi:MAG: ABC transporter ATP-binding protein [Ignavibacteriaceae bacterium]
MVQFADNNFVAEVKDVYKSFKTVDAVKGISLKIHKGQFIALLGPNGAGKTTLVEMIEGIQKPDKGEILILNKHWKGNEDEIHNAIGLSLQETRFIDKLTVKETLNMFASFYELKKDRVDQIINLVGLEEKKKSYTVNLSGGQKQKLALGIALLNNPKILLLDEPTTGLDPNARREIWSILNELKEKSQTSLLLTTHYMEEAERLCDYIVIMDYGKILKEGTLTELLNEGEEHYIEFILERSANPEQLFKNSAFNIEWDPVNNKGLLVIRDIETDLPGFLNFLKEKNLRLNGFESRRKTLDDLFINLAGRHLNE